MCCPIPVSCGSIYSCWHVIPSLWRAKDRMLWILSPMQWGEESKWPTDCFSYRVIRANIRSRTSGGKWSSAHTRIKAFFFKPRSDSSYYTVSKQSVGSLASCNYTEYSRLRRDQQHERWWTRRALFVSLSLHFFSFSTMKQSRKLFFISALRDSSWRRRATLTCWVATWRQIRLTAPTRRSIAAFRRYKMTTIFQVSTQRQKKKCLVLSLANETLTID